MKFLRNTRVNGRRAVQTPVISVRERAGRRSGAIVLTAHLGEPVYFQSVLDAVGRLPGTVFFESVRTADASDEHWRERYHRFLRAIREDVYRDIASLGLFAFQGDHLRPGSSWVNADVDCCQLAARLREKRVSVARYEAAIALLHGLVLRARDGNAEARKNLESMVKYGLLFLSFSFVFDVLKVLPSVSGFQAVVNDWRTARAVRQVLRDGDESFVLVYGAAHGPGILRLLERAGFEEVDREWLTVFRV
jgi:hypothetical protein